MIVFIGLIIGSIAACLLLKKVFRAVTKDVEDYEQ